MTDRGSIALRYAQGLYRFASRHHAVERVGHDAGTFSAAWARYPALGRVMGDRLLLPEKKEEVARAVCPAMGDHFAALVALVLRQRRAPLLGEICREYTLLVQQHEGLVDVFLTTAVPMDPPMHALFERELAALTGRRVAIHPSTDSTLIGGYVVRWGTYRLDRSVAGRLKKIENDLRNDG